MPFPLRLIWLLPLVLLASCARPPSDACTGWGQVQVEDATVDYLAAQDPGALETMTANQLYGLELGCWQ